MSAKLPRISGRVVIRALKKIGYEQVRQRGSHIACDVLRQQTVSL
jgi:predicted RNA binding protein YcfA (HicA-like mRNA interferase family)